MKKQSSNQEPQTPQAPTRMYDHLSEDNGLVYTMIILILLHLMAYAMRDPCTC